MPSIRPLNPNVSVFADPKFGQSSAPRLMDRIDRSMGIPAPASIEAQARATVMRLAKMEQERRILTTKGYAAAANKTLQGMGELFASGPTTAEMQGVLKNAMTNGGIVSGKDYYDKIQRGVSPSFSHTANSPENLKAYAQRAADAAAGAVPAALRPYIRPSIQAASYVYATRQAQQTGAALAGIPDSIVDRARLAHMAQERATYLMGLAGLGANIGGVEFDINRIQDVGSIGDCFRYDYTFNPTDDNRSLRAMNVAANFAAIFGRAAVGSEIEYWGATKWCSSPNETMAGQMRAVAAKSKGIPATPGPAEFPGGPTEFNKAFSKRGDGSDIPQWLKDLVSIGANVGGGGGAGGGMATPCPLSPDGRVQLRNLQTGLCSPVAEETDWTTIALWGAAAVAAFYVVKNIQR